jgi:hypothetical protein
MPFGNSGPFGVPTMPVAAGPYNVPAAQLAVLNDPRAYATPETTVGKFQPIFHPGRNPLATSQMSPYAKAVASTPGLSYWWRFGVTYNGNGGNAPGGFTTAFPNYAGPTTLGISGTVNIVTGLIPGDTDGAAQLVRSGSGNLKEGDYLIAGVQANECFTHECWVNLTSTGVTNGNFSLGGAWDGSNGWLIYVHSGGQLQIILGGHTWSTAFTFVAGITYYLVFVFGGPADYPSYLYVNSVQVDTTSAASWSNPTLVLTTRNYEVGKYNNTSVGSDYMDGVIDELALYDRMLQPAEIAQHYAAAFARQ